MVFDRVRVVGERLGREVRAVLGRIKLTEVWAAPGTLEARGIGASDLGNDLVRLVRSLVLLEATARCSKQLEMLACYPANEVKRGRALTGRRERICTATPS